MMSGPLWVARASDTWRAALILRTSVIAFRTALARIIINSDRGDWLDSLGYIPKTRRVGMSLSGPAVLLIALIAIYSLYSYRVVCPISTMITLYAR